MDKLKRSIALLLVIGLMLTGMPINNVYAAEAVQSSNTSTVSEEVQIDSQNSDNETDKDVALNYIYVESPTVNTPGEQNVVVSLGDDSDDIENVELFYQKDNEEIKSWQSSKSADGAFLFTKAFTNEDSGIYDIVSVSFNQNGTTHEIVLNDIGHEAHFGVNKTYNEDKEEALQVQEDGTLLEKSVEDESVVTEDNAVVEADSSDMEQISNDVKAAIKSQVKAKTAKSGDIVVYLDPGHDASHVGATANGLREEVLTLKIAQYCKAELEQYSGVKVYMTRSSSACPYPGTSSSDCLNRRIQNAVSNGADAYVSIHLNSASSSANGAEVWYWYNNSEGKTLAEKVQTQIVALGLNNRGAKPDSPYVGDGTYAVTRECNEAGIPGIIIEHAFITGNSDANFLKSEANLKKLGVADATGIAATYGVEKITGKWIVDSKGKRYQYDNGKYATGYTSISGKYYYFDSQGYMKVGHQMINGKPYQFYTAEGYGYGKGWINYIDGKKAYCIGNGELKIGLVNIEGEKYWFNSEGYAYVGYVKIDDKYYYFDEEYRMQVGHQMINGKPYQFYTAEGYGYGKGWINYIDGKKAYCIGGGQLVTGEYTIDGEKYKFDKQGFLVVENEAGWIETDKGKKYKFDNGEYATGYTNIDSKYYYFDTQGYMQVGHQMINGKPYQFYTAEGYGYRKGWINYSDGKRAYCLGEGELQTGYIDINGKYYYFDSQGYMQVEHQMINGKPYQFYTAEGYGYGKGWINYIDGKKAYCIGGGQLQTGYTNIDGKYYYFDSQGYMQVGHQMINGKPYQFYTAEGYGYGKGWINYSDGKKAYCLGEGELAIGSVVIDGIQYIFDEDGYLLSQNRHSITGKTNTSASKLASYYRQKSPIGFPNYYASHDKEASTLEQFCQIYVEEAAAENINVEVAFCQAMLETGWLQFKGAVTIDKFNFAGIGAVDSNPVDGAARFSSVREGIRAQIQHLKAYANKDKLVNDCVDPRFHLVTRGIAPYVEDLGGRWASDKQYGYKIVELMKEI